MAQVRSPIADAGSLAGGRPGALRRDSLTDPPCRGVRDHRIRVAARRERDPPARAVLLPELIIPDCRGRRKAGSGDRRSSQNRGPCEYNIVAVSRPSFLPSFLICVSLAAVPCAAAVDFHADVRPILSDRCYTCHGPDEATRMSPLRLDTEEGAFAPLAGGGFAIVRGKPEESELVRRVEASDAARRMPPSAMGPRAPA